MSHMTEVPLHDGAAPQAFLVGTWSGSGTGRQHDHEPFD
jgi:hypothetical protein